MSGVYIITHTSGYFYIGSSVNITNRWSAHIDSLIKNTHHSQKFQSLFNQSDITQWTFQIVTKVSKTALKQATGLKGKALDAALKKEVLKEERLIMSKHNKQYSLNTDIKYFK